MKKIVITIMTYIVLQFATGYGEEFFLNGRNCALGVASWYSRSDPGICKTTANMEAFSDKRDTCAMWNMPFNTLVKVTNLLNGRSIVVRVNDRGPAKHLVREGRIIDLTKSAFSKIAVPGNGLIPIEITALRR